MIEFAQLSGAVFFFLSSHPILGLAVQRRETLGGQGKPGIECVLIRIFNYNQVNEVPYDHSA